MNPHTAVDFTVSASLGDREWLQEYQAVHGRDDVKELRAAVLLLRVRMPAVFDLEIG